MIKVNNIPSELQVTLDRLTEVFFNIDEKELQGIDFDTQNKKHLSWQETTSKEYLLKQQSQKASGFPAASRGIDFGILLLASNGRNSHMLKYTPILQEINNEIQSFFCSRHTALMMYYPPGGFIDWHTNANAYGYNALLTYSKTGQGAFFYQHPHTKEIVTLQDEPGWSLKLGSFDMWGGSPLWHSAYTECERLTWSYIIPDNMWRFVAEEVNVDVNAIENVLGYMPVFDTTKSNYSVYHANS
jgi:hypothetical protein